MSTVEYKSLDEVVGSGIDSSPIDLVTKSGTKFVLANKQWLKPSLVLFSALEGDPTASEIELDARDDLMRFVVTYLNMCQGQDIPEVPKPLSSKVMAEVLVKSPFNNTEPFEHKKFATYIDEIGDADKQQLYDLVMCANFLNIKGLLHLGLAKVCTWIKGYPIGDLKHRLLPAGAKDFKPHFSMAAPGGGHSLVANNRVESTAAASG